MTGARVSYVHVVDLGLVNQPFSPEQLLSQQRQGASAALGPGLIDIGRVLIRVDAAKICAKAEVLSSIRRAPSVRSALVVAVGPSPNGLNLEVPTGSGADLPIIWVSDEAGAEWSPNDPLSAVVVIGEGKEQTDRLVAALSLPEVFDAVGSRLRENRWLACSVGLETLTVGRRDELSVHLAEVSVTDVLGSEDAKAGVVAGSLVEEGVVGRLHRCPTLDKLLAKGGRLSLAFERVHTAVDDARQLHEELTEAKAPWAFYRAELEESPQQIGSALEVLELMLAESFRGVDVRDGLSPTESEAVRNLGVDPEAAAEIQRVPAEDVTHALWSEVKGDIDRVHPLEAIAQRVDAVGREAPPRTSKDSLAALSTALPLDFTTSYERAAVPNIALAEPIGLLLFFLGAFLASVWSLSSWWVVPIALLLSTITALAIDVALSQTRDRRHFGLSVEIVNAWWALAAVGVGVALGITLGFLSDMHHLGSIGLVLLSVGPFFLAIRRAWARWRATYIDAIRVPELDRRIAELERLVASTIHDDWLLASQRLHVEQYALNLSAALRAVIEQLHAPNGSESGPSTGAEWSARGVRAGEAYPALERVIGADYAHLIEKVVEHNWALLVAGRVAQVRRAVAESCQAALERYRAHLSSHGVLVAPTLFDAIGPTASRGDLIQKLWQTVTNDADEILRRTPADALVQLADPQHLRLLDSEPANRFQVCFLPEAASEVLRVPDGGDADRVLTQAKHMAGILRLVRLRPGTVVEEQCAESPGTPATPETVGT